MNLSYRIVDDMGIVRAHASRIDASAAIRFKERFAEVSGQIARALEPGATGGRAGSILLDMTEVEFLDSSGLGAIVAARKSLGGDRTLALAGLQPMVQKVMRLTHMDRVFPIYVTADDFLAGLDVPHVR